MNLLKLYVVCLLTAGLIGCGTEKKVDMPNNSALAAETNTGLISTGHMGKSGVDKDAETPTLPPAGK